MSQSQQPNWTLPLILSTVLAAGGTFVYWHQYSHKPKQEKADTLQKKPLALPSEDSQIAMIKVKTAKGLIEVKCQDLVAKNCKASTAGKWKVTHPVELEADGDNVKDFLTSATSVLSTETVDLKEETPEKRLKLLEEYGLSDKMRTDIATQFVELITEDGKRYTAWFGSEHPIGDKFFVARSVDGKIVDETIFLISNYYKNNLAKDLTYFRDKTLFTFLRGDIDSFEATTSSGKLSGKRVNALWEINGLPGEHDRIETALSAIGKTSAKEFPESDSYKGAKAVSKYVMKSKDKTYEIELLEKPIAEAKGPKKYFAKVNTRPEVVEVDSILITQMDKKLTDFRKQSIFSETEKVTATQMSIQFNGAKTSHVFEYKNNAWIAKDPSLKDDLKKPQALVDALAQVRIGEFVSSVPPGGKEEMVVSLGDDQGPERFKFRFVAVKDQIYAIDLHSKRKEAFKMNDSMKSTLPFTEDSWKMK